LWGGGVGRGGAGGAGGGPGCDMVVGAQLLVKLTFLSKTTKKSPLSPHRTLPRFKHSSSDDRRSKTSLLNSIPCVLVPKPERFTNEGQGSGFVLLVL